MEGCLIFVEPVLEDLISLVPCFQIECSELRLAAFTIVPVEAVGVAKWMVLFHERRQWENRRWNCRSIGRIGFVALKITHSVVCVACCMLQRTIGSCGLFKVFQYGVPHIRSSPYWNSAINCRCASLSTHIWNAAYILTSYDLNSGWVEITNFEQWRSVGR
jgi:hypothetical protein